MQIIIHRVNTIKQLKTIPNKYGVEIDVRETKGQLILNHEAFGTGDLLEKYLKHYGHAFIIFNIKEAGIEAKVIELAKKHNIKKYFLLDVEAPYLYRASHKEGIRNLAVRYSEVEPIETLEYYRGKVDWVWIDTVSQLPIDKKIIEKLKGFKTCLVCPERWGRPEDIFVYKEKMKKFGFSPTAVMTAFSTVVDWEK